MFCVRCGKEAPLTEALCAECFLATQTLATVPGIVRVEICAGCGARHRGGSWSGPRSGEAVSIEECVREGVEVDRRVGKGWTVRLEGGEHDPTNFEYDVIVAGKASGVPFEVRAPVVVHLQRSTCTRCGRRSGGYYESILQVRAEGRLIDHDERDLAARIIDRGLKNLEASGDLDSFLVRAEEVKGGWDFYLGTVHAGRTLAKALQNELGATLRESPKLVGRDKTGNDIYRVTILARLPPARIGGFVAEDERLYAVMAVGPKTTTLTDLQDHRRLVRERSDLDTMHVLEPGEAMEAVVVSESPRELQLLDPGSMRTVEVVRPVGFPTGKPSVRVVRWNDRLWLLPESGR